ncbi:unnamed protein product [Prorocentrum cordatum]|uniref:O-fucosyltransferase family protein n=1 Tax=Prorocentrum cordatum TaxID=2364126 RepID=A0ABN9QGD9_9DINO|nr:unnamed protein product [Polarella glacialis]
MARGVRTLLALAALPRAATLQAEPLQAEPLQAEVQPEAQQLPDFSAPARARSAMMPELEHGSNHRVGSVPNATLSDCLLCVTHPADSPKLWVQESSDGVGTRVHNMLIAMAVAAKNGMNIAGFVSIPFECPIRIYHGMPYNVDPKLVYDYFFGLNSTDLFVNMRQPHVAKYSSMAELEKYTTDLIPIGKPDPLAPGSQSFIEHADILMQFGSLRTTKSQIQQYITKDFISNLRAMGSRVTSHPTFFAKDGRPTVAVHVRRGDVKRLSANNHRWSPDSWYLDKINKIRHILPDADVHVFTNVDEEPTGRRIGRAKRTQSSLMQSKLVRHPSDIQRAPPALNRPPSWHGGRRPVARSAARPVLNELHPIHRNGVAPLCRPDRVRAARVHRPDGRLRALARGVPPRGAGRAGGSAQRGGDRGAHRGLPGQRACGSRRCLQRRLRTGPDASAANQWRSRGSMLAGQFLI